VTIDGSVLVRRRLGSPGCIVLEEPPCVPIGALVHVRQRQWIVESITSRSNIAEFDLVDLACVDDDAQGALLSVFWQAEVDARVLDENPWARLGATGFDDADVFAAYLHTRRWNSVTATDTSLFQAPFRAGIRIDAYQLEPLRKALLLPRVNLFIADDVGLGKTIEADLIARELLLRRKVTSIVVIAPPSMLPQWHEELETRFGLSFVIIDRDYFTKVRRERGLSGKSLDDCYKAIVTSANPTPAAYFRNIELGVVITGGDIPAEIDRHFRELIVDRDLERLNF
jgi:hypothetical protein